MAKQRTNLVDEVKFVRLKGSKCIQFQVTPTARFVYPTIVSLRESGSLSCKCHPGNRLCVHKRLLAETLQKKTPYSEMDKIFNYFQNKYTE